MDRIPTRSISECRWMIVKDVRLRKPISAKAYVSITVESS